MRAIVTRFYTRAVSPTGVIDLGSNSARLIVADLDPAGHFEMAADARAGLRLLRRIAADGSLPAPAIALTCQVINAMTTVARNAGADKVVAVATSALRETTNRNEVVEAVARETGVELRVVDGEEEAMLACRGAIHSLPVDTGLNLDIGGGSLEISSFSHRTPGQSWSLQLGALRLNDTFLVSDPPKKTEVSDLRQHVLKTLNAAALPSATAPRDLVGTGGTIRAVAKIARSRHSHDVPGVHGYQLTRPEIEKVLELTSNQKRSRVSAITGVNSDRAVSLAAGANTLAETMDYLAIPHLLVSGQGLREGLALTLSEAPIKSAREVRAGAVAALARRFSAHSPQRAEWRVAIALALIRVLVEDNNDDAIENIKHAAKLIDIGRSIDFYNRHEHTCNIILRADLPGFSQRQRAQLAATVEKAGGSRTSSRRYRPLLSAAQMRDVERAGVILALADGIEPRTHPTDKLAINRLDSRREIILSIPLAAPWYPEDLLRRASRAFGKRLVIAGAAESNGSVSIDVR
jgi:exopolyphosphatase/guanosine-5'-triphosphate,3'-diphosphate pyrophosphatase